MSETTSAQAGSEATGPQPNTVNWWELQVPDLDEAKQFYGAVFGWSFRDVEQDVVVICLPDGTMIGALDPHNGKGKDPAGRGTRLYVQVDDLEETLARVTTNGGQVHSPRQLIAPEYGWWAAFVDPSGLVIGLTSMNPAR